MRQLALFFSFLAVCSVLSEPFFPSNGFYIPLSYERYPEGDGVWKSQMKRKVALTTNTELEPFGERRSMFDLPKRDYTLQRQQLKRMKPCFYSPIQCLMKRSQ
ncbi:hypothetical protein QR680_002630 [Steinernema hermaphroditum]|uniref:Uncharacterized protein n=1 Tax=Steinernema hermaphroditum TaxID=289476 RepID=A0AA39H4C0_9BILA|nr:hypothetical protein QR680_002630 [Steinernema hermaphroditum]